MKVCLINNLYKPFNRGGAEKVTETIARGLKNAGHEVFIIATKPRFSKPIPAGEIYVYCLDSLYFNLDKLPKFFRFFWHLWDMFSPHGYFKIKKILEREKPDAVITNNLMGLGFQSVRAIKKSGARHLHIVHDIQLIHPSGLMYYGQEKYVHGFAARNFAGLMSRLVDSPKVVIFPSRWLMNLHLEKIFFIKSKRLVLPNPVEEIGAAGRERDNSIFKFFYVGQIEKHKGVLFLIEVFTRLSQKYPEIKLIIAGDGSQLSAAKRLAGNNRAIEFLGRVEEDKINELLKTSDCLIYPSLVYENCPNAIQRAMYAGLPVIASNLGGISELLNKNAGLLFEPANQAELAAKIEWALTNQNELKNLAANSLERAAMFKLENYIKEIISLLK